MPVPASIAAKFRPRTPICFLALFVALSTPLLAARNPDPALRIPLEPIGFQNLSAQFLLAGSSMYTLHYVDDKHLLLTYSTHRLLKRLPDEPPEDQDRYVEAVLLELPSGHVLGRTQWRLHDRGQYLWSLGHGRFLLRVRDTLTTFAPVANLSTPEPFRERPFLTTDRRIGAVILSPEADLMILETIKRQEPDPASLPSVFSSGPPTPHEADPTSVQINLFRLFNLSSSSDEIGVRVAGSSRARALGRIPATAEGYLAIIDQGRSHWAFDFNSYSGKTSELSPFDSSCRPVPIFVSRSEFIAFGCHGTNNFQVISGFNMRGEQMWQQTVLDSYFAPSFVFAPSSGRFALSRLISHAQSDMLIPELIGGQSIVVYQTDSGKQILHVDALPVQRSGQNFSLSPDGMDLAIVHGDAIEVYHLPPLTNPEKEAVKQAQASAPPTNDAPISFTTSTTNTSPATESVSEPPTPAPASAPQPQAPPPSSPTNDANAPGQSTTTNPASNPPKSAPAPSSGDTDPNQPEPYRKAPTLYNAPSDPPPNQPTTQPQ
ncbi:MAG TPA: hypothetical protein VK578_04385 [Edaphobacter sp.]|nr:hypothetical protein [Edaphobacter sp.]